MLKHLLSTASGASDDLNKTRMSSGQQHIDPYAWHAPPPSTSVTGTSELFSATYAMLSDTPAYPEQWSGGNKPSILFEQPQIQPVGNNYDPPVRFDPPFAYRQQNFMIPGMPQAYYPPRALPTFPNQNPYQNQQFYTQATLNQAQQLINAAPALMRPEPLRPTVSKTVGNGNNNNISRTNSNNSVNPSERQQSSASTTSPSEEASLNSPALTSSGSAASGTPPLANDLSATDMESNDEERVMCMACRGVYPSRRSLTGHIGRNEKCREIIGRNYLDALASGTNPPIPGTDAAIKSGAITTGQDGMSPVCPYCDRFISHYKGNIRRHINQCCKNTEPLKRPRMGSEGKSPKKRRKTEDGFSSTDYQDHDGSSGIGSMMSPHMSPTSSSFYPGASGSDLCSPDYSNYDGKSMNGSHKRDQTPPDDAYICEDCDFVTVYKGNMKRHLNTCHPLPDCKNLKVPEWDEKLEAMRASNMGICGDKLQEKLAAHKQNSSRGRKPRKKKENQNNTDEFQSEPMIDEFKPILNLTSMIDKYPTFA